jgi:hypothetical protein
MCSISSPRTRVALQYFLYGGKSQLDAARVEEIISGFQNFRELMVPATSGEGPAPKLEPIDPATKEALLLLFSPEGSFVQDLLLTEVCLCGCFYGRWMICWFSGFYIKYCVSKASHFYFFEACANSGCFVSTGNSRIMEFFCNVYSNSSSCRSSYTRFLATSTTRLVVGIKSHRKTYRGRCEIFRDSEKNMDTIGT